MGYELMGRAHAALHGVRARLAREHGQGTVEYVALILLIAAVMAAVVTATTNDADGKTIAGKIVTKLKDSIDGVGDPPKNGR
jgi:hypothetical protein